MILSKQPWTIISMKVIKRQLNEQKKHKMTQWVRYQNVETTDNTTDFPHLFNVFNIPACILNEI